MKEVLVYIQIICVVIQAIAVGYMAYYSWKGNRDLKKTKKILDEIKKYE